MITFVAAILLVAAVVAAAADPPVPTEAALPPAVPTARSAEPPVAATIRAAATREVKEEFPRPAVLPPTLKELSPVLPSPVVAWLDDWRAREVAGHPAKRDDIEALRQLLLDHDVSAQGFAGVVRLVAYIDGPDAIAPLYMHALARAERELGAFAPPDPRATSVVEALWPLHELFACPSRWDADERLLSLLRKWEVRGSPHSQWANYQYADSLYMPGRYEAALAAFKDVVAERQIATQPSEGLNRSLDWELGLSAFGAERYDESIQYFWQVMADRGNPYVEQASYCRCVALYRAGNRPAAVSALKEHVERYHLSRTAATKLARDMQDPRGT